uniref:Uncharacterized protein n=1 Tax=Ascaris lumbricoides TaxID=6252 RepID=A0A0M3IPB9_ASCLU
MPSYIHQFLLIPYSRKKNDLHYCGWYSGCNTIPFFRPFKQYADIYCWM